MDKTCRETTRSQAEFLSTISSEVKKKAKEVGNILDLAPRFAAPAPKTAETGEPVKNLHGVLVMWGPTLVNQDRGKCNIAIEDPPIWC